MFRTVRRIAPLLSSLLFGAALATAAGGLAGCADENEPETWVKRLNDPATRVAAVNRLVQFYEDKMSKNKGDRAGAEVKPLLDEIVPPMTERCVAGDLDERTSAKLVKFLADTHDPRAESCYIKVLKDFKPDSKETEENVRWVARAIGPMQHKGDIKGSAGPLMDVFLALRPSKLKKEPELYRDVHDAMVQIADPSWETQLIDRLNRPITDRKDVATLRDEVYWQTTAAEILGILKSANAVKPLIKEVLSPSKADIAVTAINALIKIGKPSVGPSIALLRGEDADLVKYSKEENLKASAGPDGKVPDSAAKAAEKSYVGTAAIIIAAIGRDEGAAALISAIDKLDKGDDLARAIIARELPKLPKNADVIKTFEAIYEKTPTNLSIPPGSGARESLLENASYFFDASLVPWIAKTAVDLKGEAEDVDAIRAASLTTCLKLMTPDQAGDVEKLFSIKAQGPDGKPTTLGKAYEKEYKITKDLLAACGNKTDCYIGKATEPAAQQQETQFQGIKSLYMLGVYGGPDVRQKLIDAMPKLTNPALRFTAVQVIDRLSPKGDPAMAAALQKIVDEGEASKDGNKMAGNSSFKMVIYRLNARAQGEVLRLEVTQGLAAGVVFEPTGEVVSIGRAPSNDIVLDDMHVSGEHARVVVADGRVVLHDLRSTNGTHLIRGGERRRLTADAPTADLESGDAIELGSGDGVTSLQVTIADEHDAAHIVSMRRLDEVEPAAAKIERDPNALGKLYAAQKRIVAATDLDSVLIEVADAVLFLVPTATHVTLVLRDDEQGVDTTAAGYVPVMTRVRLPGGQSGPPAGPVPITRSIYRRVVKERVAVLAADAPTEVGDSESIMGAAIRSTIGVPLWKGEDIIGVLQADNRKAVAMEDPQRVPQSPPGAARPPPVAASAVSVAGTLNAHDVELLLVLAANASLAVANARLIKRLTSAEDRLLKENNFLKGREEKRRSGTVEIIGKSEAMAKVIDHLDKVVDTRVTVLIEGETGTGKELIAAAVHYRSRRRDKLFVAQNCAALAESLLESELFGHKKGSFTGASDEKKGLFEIADGGTLFLDEITETPMSLQSKLLRALQEGEIRPVGATAPKHVNVRIVAATNRNLEDEVKAGRFREDLYYRLKVFPIRLPPLRERREDIPILAAHFLVRYALEIGKPVGGFSVQAMELMLGYNWPGNVRELQNEVQRLVIQLEPGAFATPELLSPRIRQVEGLVGRAGVTKGTLKDMMDSVEKYFIIEALRDHGNNKTNAARTLGITREGLHKKLRQFGI